MQVTGDLPHTLNVNSCYHCLIMMSRKKDTHNSSIVIKKYGSIVNNFTQSSVRYGQIDLDSMHDLSMLQQSEIQIQDKMGQMQDNARSNNLEETKEWKNDNGEGQKDHHLKGR